MGEKKNVSKFSVIIYCIGAVIWNINLFLDLAYGNTDSGSFILHIVCAIAWDIMAVAWILYYLKFKKDNDSN